MADTKEIREREHLRRTFNRTVISIEAHLLKGDVSPAVIDMEFLKEKHARLEALNRTIQDRMLENYNETEYSKEIDVAEGFSHTWHSVKNRLDTAVSTKLEMKSDNTPGTGPGVPTSTRNFRLPRIEFKQFDDDPKSWLSFWGQFRKVHEDPNICADDKFQYLLQAMKEGTDAKALVERFPPSSDNYEKAVGQLIARFAREDMLIQVYIREILQLVLNQSRNQLDIKTLYDRLSTYLLALESLGITKLKYETILYPMVESSIPENILVAFNRKRVEGKEQLAQLLEFLKSEVEAEERIRLARTDFTNTSSHSDLAGSDRVPTASCIVSNIKPDTKHGKDTCLFCNKTGHSVYECSKACKMSLEEKKEAIKKGGCCYICLRKGHMANKCKTFVKCLICSKKHSVLLCPNVHREENKSENILVCHKTNTTTLLQTLVVHITYNGQTKKVRALLDSGSQRSYVRSSIAEELQLQQVGTESIAHIVFGGDDRPAKVYKCFELQVSDLSNSFFLKINALEQPKLCGHLPKLNSKKLLYELEKRGIKISDIYFPDTEIDLLIGSDYLGSIMTNNLVSVGDNVIAMETKLGWTVQGPTEVLSGYSSVANTITSVSCFSQMNIPDMWSVELLGIQDPYEKQCKQADNREILNNFYDNISVNGEGRYEVSLLWKEGCPKLNPNYEVARKRLESTTKKLMSTGNLKDYDYVLNDWKEKNIIEEVINDDKSTGHYLPHHMVIKPSSTTTKVRPVFDASSRDQYGQSLNSCVNKGINMIEMIPRLLLSFRKCAHGVIADVKQAFLQISVMEEDRNYLKFLWWDNPDTCDRIVTYRHNRVVFGISCSPFLLSATINYHLDNCSEDYKETARKLKECLYSDNAVTSFDTTAELDTFILQATHLMSQGHFELRGWVTAPERRQETASETSVLGMIWNTQEDSLHCNVNMREISQEKVTKRHLLSVTQHVFDPIGIVCATTLIPKLIIQKVWESKIGWDQEIPVELKQQFVDWQESAHLINKCNLPRRVSSMPISQSKTSLHVFCDASERAYAACAFLKTEDKTVSVRMLLAKNRVAPANNKMSLPRLELMSAVIASRLYREIIDSRLLDDCQSYERYFWTDSAVVLAWLQRQAEWKPFVSNRVKEILTVTKKSDWYHVPGTSNPADLPSRGCSATKLLESKWWEGPDWLKLSSDHWPKSNIAHIPIDEDVVSLEQKKCVNVHIHSNAEPFSTRLLYFSKYNQIVRMTAWLLRLNPNVRKKFQQSKDISSEEYLYAEQTLTRLLQKESYNEESSLPNNVNTMTDDNGILRVRTRLELCHEHKDFVNPILLPGNNEIVKRFVRQSHEKMNHAGTQTLLSKLREKYWIMGSRRLVKKTISSCVVCRKYKCKHYEIPEAPLPTDRVENATVFQVSGVDFAGPLFLRNQQKCWIALFTCATYRAVHLELVESLSTSSFLMALRRFVARRGRIDIMYSDNATNFQGTANLLKEVDWAEVEAATATNFPAIKWKFIPPKSPWWGGWWERLIKVMKEILRRMLGNAVVDYVELSTLLCDCEATINSRPLTYVATDDDSLRPLSPMLFLHGLSTSDLPDLDQIDSKNINIRLKFLQKLRSDFRQRFKNEYLALLISKNKCKPYLPKVGDIVLVGTEASRLYWPLGIIMELFTGADGQTRVAKVRTAAGVRVRTCQKLYPLELSAVTEEWLRLPTDEGKKPDDMGMQSGPNCVLEQDASSKSEETPIEFRSSNVEPLSAITRKGRVVKIPQRFLD